VGGFLGPSCRPLRSTSQPPADAGPHLYPAQQDSARTRTLSWKSYWLSWVTPFTSSDFGALLPFPHFLSWLYHKFCDLSSTFFNFFWKFLRGGRPRFAHSCECPCEYSRVPLWRSHAGLSSLSDCIIAQVFSFVKPFLLFFYFFLPVLPSPFQGCRDTFFRRLVHIYIPQQQDSVRWGLGGVSYRLSWVSATSLHRLRSPRPLWLYYSTGSVLCQHFFLIFLDFFGVALGRFTLPPKGHRTTSRPQRRSTPSPREWPPTRPRGLHSS